MRNKFGVYLTRQEHAENGWLIGWNAPSRDDWNGVLASIQSLPRAWRIWRVEERAWWIAEEAWPRIAYIFDNAGEVIHRRTNEKARLQPIVPREVQSAYAALHITLDAPVEILQSVYRTLAKMHHPDVGGKPEAMKNLNAWYEIAKKWAEACSQA